MGTSRLWWKRFVEKVSFELGMRFLTVINFLYSSVFQRCYQGLKPRGKRRRGKYYTHF